MGRTETKKIKRDWTDLLSLLEENERARGYTIVGKIDVLTERGPWVQDQLGGGPGPIKVAGVEYEVKSIGD